MRVMVVGDSVVNGGSLTDQSHLATTILERELGRGNGTPLCRRKHIGRQLGAAQLPRLPEGVRPVRRGRGFLGGQQRRCGRRPYL